MTDTILFDLDGTLIPMDQEEFTNAYFRELLKVIAPLGYEKDSFITALWAGTKAMAENNGEKTNRERFWDKAAAMLGERIRGEEPLFDKFYAEEFNRAVSAANITDTSRELVRMLRSKGYGVILATNAIFPLVAVHSRLGWLGLEPSDFDIITSYETCRYAKPNLDYYRAILERAGKSPEQCLMVGNNVKEDMCAEQLNMPVYLVTGYVENADGADTSRYDQGSIDEFFGLAKAFAPVPRPGKVQIDSTLR